MSYEGPSLSSRARSTNVILPRLLTVALSLILMAPMALAAVGGPAPGPLAGAANQDELTAQDRYSIAERNAWVPAWLASMDHDGDLVDDRAEGIALEHVQAGAPQEGVGLLVSFDHWPTDTDRDALRGLDAEVVYTFHRIPTVEVQAPASSVEATGDLPGVVAVEWNEPLEPALDVGPIALQAREHPGTGDDALYNGRTAESLGYTGEGMVIAVLDTGVRDSHAALEGKWVTGAVTTSGTTECVNPEDDDGHGTHVAGIAMGNEEGSDFKGAARDAELVEVKISAGPGSLGGSNRGFEWVADYNDAIDNGSPKCGVDAADRIDVATLSFGSAGAGGENAGSAETLIRDLTRQGVVVTIAVGNCGPSPSATCDRGYDENGISSPGNAAGSIGVANVRDQDTADRADDDIAPSSSRGPNEGVDPKNLTDRFRKPELGAPGTDIMSANSLPEPFVQYYELSGTSMSTPMLAGVAALILEAGEDARADTGGENVLAPTGTGYMGDGSYAPGEHLVREALVLSADYKTAGVSSAMLEKWEGPGMADETWNNAHGYGEANAFSAICWSWRNVLDPAGAQPSDNVSAACGLEDKPLSVATGDPAWTEVGEDASLSATAEGGAFPHALQWSVTEAPSGANVTLEGATSDEVAFTTDTPGAYLLEVTVTDATGTTASDTVPVTAYEPGPTGERILSTSIFEDDAGNCVQEGWRSVQIVGYSAGPSGSTTAWHLEDYRADTAPCAWYHGTLAGTYEDNQNTYILSPGGSGCYDLDAGYTDARFSFQTAGSLEADFDYLHVEVSDCDADSWTTLRSFTGAHGDWTTDPATYEELTVDLGDLIGDGAFQLRLRVRTDAIVNEEGYRVDSFELSASEPEDNTAPVASFATSCDHLTCTFDATASHDPDGTLLSHVWQLGDGTERLGETITHTFAEGGNYTVTFTVTDDEGARNAATEDVGVRGPLDLEALDPRTVTPGTTTVDLLGSNFLPGAAVDLANGPGSEPEVTVLDVDPDGTWLRVNVTVSEGGPKDTTSWDVTVVNPDGESDTLLDGLYVYRAENDQD